MDLLAPDFTVVRGRPAYDVAEVDDAVAEVRRLMAGVASSSVTPRHGGFTRVRDQGYDADQVDSWSAAVRRALADRASLPRDDRPDDHGEDPPELRDLPPDVPRASDVSGFPAWVRLTALVLVVAVALFFVASYFV